MPPNLPTPSYVVRVYRCEANERRRVVGVVETVGQQPQRAFTNVEELWQILTEGAGLPGPDCPIDRESV